MPTVSLLTGEDVTSRYETLSSGVPGPLFAEYQALDRFTNRAVRVRTLTGRNVHPDLVDAVTRAMERVAALSHPAIEKVLDIVRVGNSVAVVSEPLRGADLDARLARVGAFPVGYALDVAIAAAEAIQTAHQSGVVHGDLHPTSVHLSAEGIVKVADLGIAGALAELPTHARPADYSSGPIPDAGSDLRSLGTLLFTLLTGRAPESASESSPAAVNHLVPGALSNLVRCLMEGAPRYQTMDEALRDLRAVRRAVQAGDPMPAIPAPIPSPIPSRRSRGVSLLGHPTSPRPRASRSGSRVDDASPVPAGRAHTRPPQDDNGFSQHPENQIRRLRGAAAAMDKAVYTPPRRRVSPLSVLARGVGWLIFIAILPPAFAIGGMAYLNYLASTPEIPVPSLRGMKADDAISYLKEVGLKASIDRNGAFDPKIPPGAVLRQIPEPGVHTKAPRSVHLVLSLGSRTVTVPSVMNKPQDQAQRIATGAGLIFKRNGDIGSPTVPYGAIAKQWPPAGKKALRGSRLAVLVSAGPSADQLEEISPDVPHTQTISLAVPHSKEHKGFQLFGGGGDDRRLIRILERSADGQERELWRASMHGGQLFTHDVTVEPYYELRVTLDGRPVKLQTQDDTSKGNEAGA